MFDFAYLTESPRFAGYFRNVDTIRDLLSEQKALTARINIYYLLTFAGSSLVLMGLSLTGASVAILGMSVPIGTIPVQILAVVTATIYGMFAMSFASLFVLQGVVTRILSMEGAEAWQFLAARFDASILWSVLISPRQAGYCSPKRHRAVGWLILSVSVLSVLAHAAIVCLSSWVAFRRALTAGDAFTITCGSFALAITSVAVLSLCAAMFLKLPFRWQS